MKTTVEQQNFPVAGSAPSAYAYSDEATVEKPGNPYYADGVEVGYTAPAKWWNWLWRHITTWLMTSKADREAMRAEMLNTLTAAGMSASDTNNRQLSKAADTIMYQNIYDYDNETTTEIVDNVEVTHKVNQPYVVGHTLFIPDTEML